MEYKVIKGVVMPRTKNERYPFLKMSVGDMFLVPCNKSNKIVEQRKIYTAMYRFIQYNCLKWQFKTRQLEKGIGVWRIS